MVTRPQVLRVGGEVPLETTPLDPGDRAEFDAFVSMAEPVVRRSLMAIHGPAVGRVATLDALAWAWQHWDKANGMRSPAAHLTRVGTMMVRYPRTAGIIADGPRQVSQEELTRAFGTAFDPDVADAFASLSSNDRVTLLTTSPGGVSIRDASRVVRRSPSVTRRSRVRSIDRLRSALSSAAAVDVETVMADGMARLDALAPTITPAEVIEHVTRVGRRDLAVDNIDDEQSRQHLIVGVLMVLAVLAAIVWWAGGRRDDVTAASSLTSTAPTGRDGASVFAPTGIAAQSELTVYPILGEAPEGYRLVDRSLTLDPSRTFGQVITGLVRNDPEPWRRRLWLFDPSGAVVASIATFDFAGTGGLDFARTIEIGGVSVEVGQEPRDGYRWWATVLGVSAGSSSTGAVFIAGVADEATVLRVATQVAALDPRSAQFDVTLAVSMGTRWQTYREPRTIDIAAARYVREDGWSSLYVSSFAAPVQSNFDIIYPAAGSDIVIRQVDGPMFVSVAAVPPGSVDAATVNRFADSMRLVRRDVWDQYDVETIAAISEPTGDLLPTGLTSGDGGPVTVGIPNGQLCVRIGKSPNPIRASETACEWFRGESGSSTASLVTIAAMSTEASPERFIAGAATNDATHIRHAMIDGDGVTTTAETPLIRDPSIGPALWAVRIPPAGRLQSIEYLDDAGRVVDRLGPANA